MQFRGLPWRRLAKLGAGLVVIAIVAGALFVWSGVYNVAASSDHWAVTTWVLERVRVQSIATWSAFVEEPPPLDDADLTRLGAAHFEGGCTPCHGRPGEPVNAIVASMLPPPPPLAEAIVDLGTKEIFWIVKHGLKYTAMPAWPAQPRNDEVWAVTSFLTQLPDLPPQDYLDLSGATRVGGERRGPEELATGSEAVALTQCVRCHGDASTPPLSDLVPWLNGQSHAYLARALDEYAAGGRASGIMQPVADVLDEDERQRITAYYAALDPPAAQRGSLTEDVERGRELAGRGDSARAIPPCLACHSAEHPDVFPSLAGQTSTFLANQLRMFRRGARDGTAYGEIMTIVARRLSNDQIRHAAAYFASLAPNGAPTSAAAAPE
jgi:cytochrome c553